MGNRKLLQKNMQSLEDLFDTIDLDHNGSVNIAEIKTAHQDGRLTFPKDVRSMIDPKHLVDMFEFLDKDNSGEVEKDEFIDGVCCLALSSLSVETLQTLQLLRSCHHMLISSHSNVNQLLGTS